VQIGYHHSILIENPALLNTNHLTNSKKKFVKEEYFVCYFSHPDINISIPSITIHQTKPTTTTTKKTHF